MAHTSFYALQHNIIILQNAVRHTFTKAYSSGLCYRVAPIGCLQEPYELKKCPTEDIADLDWPESKKIKEGQEIREWAAEINSAEMTICHVKMVMIKYPVVICDYLIKGII